MSPLRKAGCFCGILFLLALVAVRSAADDLHAVMTDPGVLISEASPANPLPFDIGFDFTVGSQSLLISDLGMFDFNGDGLAHPHAIRLWDMNSNLIATVTIPAGTDAVLLNGFRCEPLTNELTLAAGGKYILTTSSGADFVPGDPDNSYIANSAATLDAAITPGQEWEIGPGAHFVVVATPFGPFPGPNALFTVVPEPSVFALLMAGGVGLLSARRRDAKSTICNFSLKHGAIENLNP